METCKRIVSPEILEQIYMLKNALEKSPLYTLKKAQQESRSILGAANRHSVDIEINGTRGTRHNSCKRRAMKNLELAQESLAYGECCQSDIECEPCIKRAASFINGCGGHEMPYRREESRASDTGLYYTSPEKIPFEMIIYLNQNRSLSSNVERAVHAHYGIARIHPFEDGNGRLARLLQNTILHNGGLPPIIIHKYEKGEYLELMRAADVEFRENNGILRPRQVQFYNYLALKIAESLMRIRGACEGKK